MGQNYRDGRKPRSDSKCRKVPWKRIKGTGSRDSQLSVSHMIKQFNIWYRKIAKRAKKGERFCLQGYITTSNVCAVCVCGYMPLMRLKLGSTPTVGAQRL